MNAKYIIYPIFVICIKHILNWAVASNSHCKGPGSKSKGCDIYPRNESGVKWPSDISLMNRWRTWNNKVLWWNSSNWTWSYHEDNLFYLAKPKWDRHQGKTCSQHQQVGAFMDGVSFQDVKLTLRLLSFGLERLELAWTNEQYNI